MKKKSNIVSEIVIPKGYEIDEILDTDEDDFGDEQPRLFAQSDDMRAGGGWIRSAFYGGRIASAMTIGLAVKGVKGISHTVRKHSNKSNSGNDSGNAISGDVSDQYTESSSDGGSEEGGKGS